MLKLAATSSLLLAGLRPSSANPGNTQNGRQSGGCVPATATGQARLEWDRLKEAVGGSLTKVESPLLGCANNPDTPDCQRLLRNLRNPFFIGDQPWATQSSGWADAWMSAPSVWSGVPDRYSPDLEILAFDGFTIDLAGRSPHDCSSRDVPLTLA